MQVKTPFNDAIVKKYPEQIVIALAKERSGKVNPITLGWTMLTSHKPPMMAISIGLTRYSLEVIREAGEFVIAFPSKFQAEEALLISQYYVHSCLISPLSLSYKTRLIHP